MQPLREKGYLTTYENGILTESAITVTGTGNTPLDGVLALEPRYVFFDAPLTGLKTSNVTFDESISAIASTNYDKAVGWKGLGVINETQLANLTQLVNDAHDLGLTARFWNTPDSPVYARNAVWKQLLDVGADWLNADDLEAASQF